MKALEESNAEAVRSLRVQQEKSLVRQREEFGGMLGKLREKYEGRLASLRAEHKRALEIAQMA